MVRNIKEFAEPNARYYTAVGDGKTDDTTALQRAIDAGVISGLVDLPPGTYRVTKQLTATIPTGKGLTINGPGATIVSEVTDTDTLLIQAATADVRPVAISPGLSITGPGTGTGNGIRLLRIITPSNLSGLYISGFGGAAIEAQSCWLTTVDHCFLCANGNGVKVTLDPTCDYSGVSNSLKVSGCHIQQSHSHGVYVPPKDGDTDLTQFTSNHVSIENCIIQGGWANGIRAYGVLHLHLDQVYFENNNRMNAAELASERADVRLHKAFLAEMRGVDCHFAADNVYASLIMSGHSNRVMFGCNNWQGDIDMGDTVNVDNPLA